MNDENSLKTESMSRYIGYLISMGMLSLILGIIISTQVKKFIDNENINAPNIRQLNELVVILKETQNKKSDLEKQLSKLRQQVQAMNNESTSSGLSGNRLEKLYQEAGLTPIKGSGVIIKINDHGNKNLSLNTDGQTQSDDLLKIVNELKASGAKAISINNQRLVTTSEIITAGNSIMVNQSRLNSPYIIKAIGPSDTMTSALKMRGGIVEYLEAFGIKVDIDADSNTTISAYIGENIS